MEYITILLITVGLLVLVNHYIKRRYTDPPGPVGLPGFGILLSSIFGAMFSKKKLSMNEWFGENGRKYGDVWSFEMGIQKWIILHSYKAIREAMIDHGELFSGRPQNPFFKYLSKESGIISTDGEKWKVQRRFALRVLRNFGMGKSITQEKIHEEVEFLDGLLAQNVGKPIDGSECFVKAVSNVISALVFGQRWAYDDDKFLEYVSYVKVLTQASGAGLFLPIFYPFLSRPTILKMIPGCNVFVDAEEKMQKVIRDTYHKHEVRYNPEDEPTNVIEALLREKHELDERNELHTFNELQCIFVCFDLFIAGTDTTTNSLSWSMLMLSMYPDVQIKLHAEIDSVIGRERRPEMADRKTMPYTQAVMDEVMRFCTVVPHAVEHRVMHDTVFRGYNISSSTILYVDIYSVHKDPKLWEEPESFHPEHFLTKEGAYRPREHLISFGIGKRSCLGESLAQMEYFIFLVSVLQRYSVDMDAGDKARFEEIFIGTEGTIHAPGPHKIILQARDG